jgi:hypothetical protein
MRDKCWLHMCVINSTSSKFLCCRCPAVHNISSTDRCVELPDPTDPCCTVVLCDVTLGDHDVSKAGNV